MFENTLLKEKENRVLDFLYYWGRPIRVGDIADNLKIPHSTINSVLKRLEEQKIVSWKKYRMVHLTPEGAESAAHLSNHHFIIEHFLQETLDLSTEEAHREALLLAGRADCTLIQAICDKFGLSRTEIQKNLCSHRDYPVSPN
jgi:DtxR family transcriptional regulator, Mn-dependent transcriptional regulator